MREARSANEQYRGESDSSEPDARRDEGYLPARPCTATHAHNTGNDEDLPPAGRWIQPLSGPHVLCGELAQVYGAKLAHLKRRLRSRPGLVAIPVSHFAAEQRHSSIRYSNVDAACMGRTSPSGSTCCMHKHTRRHVHATHLHTYAHDMERVWIQVRAVAYGGTPSHTYRSGQRPSQTPPAAVPYLTRPL